MTIKTDFAFDQLLDPTTEPHREKKQGGFIKQRQKGYYALRLRVVGGVLETSKMPLLAQVAEKYGRGVLHLTNRLGIEIPWVEETKLMEAKKAVEAAGFVLAPCGPRPRSIFCCKGSVCPYGLVDVYKITTELDAKLFRHEVLPHKFKISVTGCPIGCAKPQLNDVGFMGLVEPTLQPDLCIACNLCVETCMEKAITMVDNLPRHDMSKCIYCGDCISVCPVDALKAKRNGLAVFAGGKFGKHPRFGYRITDFFPTDKAPDVAEKIMTFYKEKGQRGERLLLTIERVGLDSFKEAVL